MCVYIQRRRQRRVFSDSRPQSCCGLTFSTLWEAVTWHAIYGHSGKGTDVLDVSKVGGSVTAHSDVGTWKLIDSKPPI